MYIIHPLYSLGVGECLLDWPNVVHFGGRPQSSLGLAFLTNGVRRKYSTAQFQPFAGIYQPLIFLVFCHISSVPCGDVSPVPYRPADAPRVPIR